MNATLTAIGHLERVDDGGGSFETVEVTDWEGSAPAYIIDRRGDVLVVADQLTDTHPTIITVPYDVVTAHAPGFDTDYLLTTSRGKWRVTDWEDRRDHGFIRAYGAET